MQHSEELKAQALLVYASAGKAEAGRLFGVPEGTIASWASRAGVSAPSSATVVERNAHAAATIETRKQALAERMLTEAERILGQLHQRMVEKSVKVVNRGAHLGSTIEIVDVVYDAPPTADQKRIIDAVAVLIAQVQLLTGEATSRAEVTTTIGEAQQVAVSKVAQLRERMAA